MSYGIRYRLRFPNQCMFHVETRFLGTFPWVLEGSRHSFAHSGRTFGWLLFAQRVHTPTHNGQTFGSFFFAHPDPSLHRTIHRTLGVIELNDSKAIFVFDDSSPAVPAT